MTSAIVVDGAEYPMSMTSLSWVRAEGGSLAQVTWA